MNFLAKNIFLFLLTGPVLLCSPAFSAQAATVRENTAGTEVDEGKLRADVAFLSDSLCRGRATGTAGSFESVSYIVRRVRNAGLDCSLRSFRLEDGRIGRNVYFHSPSFNPGEKYIVVMAYFDGLGELGGQLYPGADSNASGVAALLSLAPALEGKNVLFAALDAHGASLAGSATLYGDITSGRFGKARRLSLVVNLDILGSTSAPPDKYWPEYLIALGAGKYSDSLEKCNGALRLHLYYDYYRSRDFTRLFYSKISDQKHFVEAGIPSVMFTSGITMSTNRTTDTADKLDYPVFARRVELILRWLRKM